MKMKCENAGLFGGATAMKNCTGEADVYVIVDENEFRMRPMHLCSSCVRYLRRTMQERCSLHGGIVKVTYGRVI